MSTVVEDKKKASVPTPPATTEPEWEMPRPKLGQSVFVSDRGIHLNSKSVGIVLNVRTTSIRVFVPDGLRNGNGGVFECVRYKDDPKLQNENIQVEGVWEFIR